MNQKILVTLGSVALIVVIGFILVKGKNVFVEAKKVDSKTAQVAQLVQQAKSLEESGQLLSAKAVYQQVMNDYPDYDKAQQVQSDLEALNLRIIFSNIEVPEKTVIHEVKSGEALANLAKQYQTTVGFIKLSNNLKSDTIRIGQKLRIWKGSFNAFVDKSQNVLLLKDGSEIVKVYHVSTGSNNSTPVGEFKIVNKLTDPVWFNKGIVVPPDSPANVLGTRWMGFDIAGYGIHGTTEPELIGQQVTAGCVRLANNDVEELYDILPVGALVKVVD